MQALQYRIKPSFNLTPLKEATMRYLLSHTIIVALALQLFHLFWIQNSFAYNSDSQKIHSICPLGSAVETDGHRRLALITGVGKYKNAKIPELKGPPFDAKRIYDLLTTKEKNGGYGFPEENVCMLIDKDATKGRFIEVFDKSLTNRAEENDQVVIFYSGHGGRARDRNGDEPDGYDETLMLHDARTAEKGDLIDDEFNILLTRLYKRTRNVTIIFDSCNSGTAMRDPAANTYISRFYEPLYEPEISRQVKGEGGDGSTEFVPETFPGFVFFSAAKDNTSALERNGRGVFTNALLQVLQKVGNQPITYAQASKQIPSLVSAESYQIPLFGGDLDRIVFGNTKRTRPISWEVIETGPPVKLGGPPIPGMGVGAELRIYGGDSTKADTADPGTAKATVVVDTMTGLNATAHIAAALPDAPKPLAGDLAVLARPSDQYLKIKVRLRPGKEPGGISKAMAEKVRLLVTENEDAKAVVELTQGPGDFELSLNNDGLYQLWGAEKKVRYTYRNEAEIPQNLWQHARQRALLQLRGEGGHDFSDNETLLVQLVPAKKQHPCANGVWEQVEPNSEQIIPLCHSWQVQVKYRKNNAKSQKSLLIGGIILSTDGSTIGFPRDGRAELLRPGESVTFEGKGETFFGKPPLDVQDHILVFGTQETNPVAWHLLTQTVKERGMGPKTSTLYRALDRYLSPGTRGQAVFEDTVEDTTWTMSSVTMRVEANRRFLKKDAVSQSLPTQKEYTIKNFDIRPYLPDNKQTALYRVLQKADSLSRASFEDGYGYKKHDWTKQSDDENLKVGIDCSRAIWFAFTRAGLTYNRSNAYLSTKSMAGTVTPMKDEFESCSDDPDLRLGDVIVYRDELQGDGHVVMVIDPGKRVAWGSHGWDGNAKKLKVEPDTGIEYQLIKYKKDWQRWDRGTMKRAACWRYRGFIEEAKMPGGLPGVNALANACDPNTCRR